MGASACVCVCVCVCVFMSARTCVCVVPGVQCTDMTYACADGTCLRKTNPECDLITDCPDGSDETPCGERERERESS